MKGRFRKISWLTLAGVALTAGSALASASGIVPLDTVINDGALLVAGAGTLATGASFLGAYSHVRGGDYSSAASHGLMGTLCGAGAWGTATYVPALGGVAAALVHPISMVVNHPVTHLFIRHLIG